MALLKLYAAAAIIEGEKRGKVGLHAGLFPYHLWFTLGSTLVNRVEVDRTWTWGEALLLLE